MRPTIDGAHGVRALEELASASKFLVGNARTAGLVENWETFSRGNILVNIGWGGSQKYYRNRPDGFAADLIPAPTPAGEGFDFSYFNWGWNYAIPRQSRHPELAYLFAAFAVAPDQSTRAVEAPDGLLRPLSGAPFHRTGDRGAVRRTVPRCPAPGTQQRNPRPVPARGATTT